MGRILRHSDRTSRLLVVIVAVLLFLLLLLPLNQRARAENSLANTITSQADILIKDEAGLKAFMKAVEKGCDFSGCRVVLQNDITMSSPYVYELNTTKNNTNTFAGIFDGNGKTIYQFRVNSMNAVSLFVKTSSTACIKNLGIVSPSSGNGSTSSTGGFVGINQGRIENCYFKGKSSSSQSGGFCYQNEGTIVGCYMKDETTPAYKNIGSVDGNYSGTASNELLEQLTASAEQLNTKGNYYYWQLDGNGLGFSETKYVKPTEGPTVEPTSTPVREMEVQVDYQKEEIVVTGPEELYFTVATKETSGQKLPQKNWRRAYKADGKFCIDFSNLKPKKQNFIALTSDSTVEKGKMTVQKIVKLVSTYRSVSFVLNYGQESPTAKGADFLTAVQVVESDKSTKKMLDLRSPDFCFEWKKGTAGAWKPMEELTLAQMESCRQTGAVLNFRLSATSTARASQIASVRVAKQSAAPVLKADISKNSLSLTNGMQFRVGDTGNWVTLNYYNKSGSDKNGYKIGSEYCPYNTKNKQECTSVRYRYLEIAQMKEYLKQAGVSEGVLNSDNGFLIQVRTAPALNKPASTIASYNVNSMVAALDKSRMKITCDSKTKKYLIEGLDATKKYEYLIVQSSVLSGESISVSESKWKKLPITSAGNGILRAGNSSSYKLKNDTAGSLITAKITDSGARVIIRMAGNKGKGKEGFSWASEPSDSVGITVIDEPGDEKR